MRTGYAFRDVYLMLWVDSPDRSLWKYKWRGSVLRLWRSIKMSQWAEHLGRCEEYAEACACG